MTHDEIRALTHSLMAETARLHAQRNSRLGRLIYNPFILGALYLATIVLCAKFVVPWLSR